jgi:hypothetical protein
MNERSVFANGLQGTSRVEDWMLRCGQLGADKFTQRHANGVASRELSNLTERVAGSYRDESSPP